MRLNAREAMAEAARCGFARAVLLPAAPLDYTPNAEGLRAGIQADPAALLDGARSVLVIVMPFQWFGAWPENSAEVSAYYFHSQRAHAAMLLLAGRLRKAGARVCEEQRLPAKLLGRAAGFGVLGRNSLLRNDAWGSCMALQTLITDIEPEGERPAAMPATDCGTCGRCVDACPTGALDGTGRVDTHRCIRAHMLRGEVIPPELRPAMGTRLLGCETCQRACPSNAGIPYMAPPEEGYEIEALLRAARDTLDGIAQSLGRNEARPQRIQAQAALAAGNSGNPAHLPMLRSLADHERAAIREHAVWAIHRIEEGKKSC